MTTKNQQDENPVDQVAKLIKNGELEEIKKITTPSGLEKLAEKQGQNILEFSLMVSDQLKRSPEGSHHKELADLGHNVEEYARNLLHWFEMRITIKEIPCIDRITYAAIHYKCKKFLSGPTTQNHLNKVWTRRYHKESDVSVKWILFNLFALFEVIFFPLIFVVYGYGIIKDRSKDDESNDHSSENHESDHPRSKNGESDHPRSKNGESDHLRSKNGESDNRRSKNYKSDDGSKRLQGVLEQYTDRFHIPYFVFVRDTLSYVALLMLHIAVCVQPSGLRLSVLEWFIMVFFIGRFMQEIDQFISERDEIHDLKTNYSNDFWNKLDVVTIVLFVITFIFRLVTWSLTSQIITNDWLVVTSLFYGINAILLSLRVFGQAMEVKKTTGTKQIALLRIISAVFVIFVQMVAAILGFSLILTKIYVSEITYVGKKATHGVCLSSDGILCWWHFFEFLAWSTVGSSDPDLLTLTTSVPNYISKTFYMLFLIVAAVMIMNMLIALLSNIYQLVEENAYDEWCYRKACLIKTYYNYHPVPVPFNIITLSIKLIYMIFSKLNPKRFKPCQEKRKDEQESIKQVNLII
ncbi:transient receptor potential cation channel subfamily M member 2 [Exaiptasia diaphana]|uniref:Ion transport domain-containing protein n=1 Tax=Exaiptasia diaphana TaxID=2652724 RepID=A0A913WY34_EXADI|nr:transient receptor potential cation channel subfamily M member 2 [Exaiptasia diaphana]